MLSFQHQGEGVPCDQIYTMPVDTPDGKPATPKLVSTGKGRTTCSYIFPSGDRMLYPSTHGASPECPPKPDYSKGYMWPIYDTYKIYTAKLDGSDLRLLTDAPGYNAEATISRDGKHIVFTSTRNGDLDVYTMNADGSHVKQLTHELGYDGGASFSANGKKIVYRAEHPRDRGRDCRLQGALREGVHSPGQSGNLGDGCRRKTQAAGDPQRRRQLRALLSIRMASGSSLPPTRPIPRAAAPSISTLSTSMGPGSSALRFIPTPTSSPCSPPTASGWCGLPTATAKSRTRPTFSLQIGWSRRGRIVGSDG